MLLAAWVISWLYVFQVVSLVPWASVVVRIRVSLPEQPADMMGIHLLDVWHLLVRSYAMAGNEIKTK